MNQIVKYFQCKTCRAINQDYKWNHSTMAKMDATSYTTRESTYCPNCLHTEYDEIEYEDLSDVFKYKMHKDNISEKFFIFSYYLFYFSPRRARRGKNQNLRVLRDLRG